MSHFEPIALNLELKDAFSSIGFIVMAGIGYLSRSSAKDVYNGSNNGVVVTFIDGGSIISDASVVYVGKTSDYVFHYDKKRQVSISIKMDNVISIQNPHVPTFETNSKQDLVK